MYLLLLLAGAAPGSEPVIAGEIRARPVPLWETTKGLVDDRPVLRDRTVRAEEERANHSLAYDLTDIGKWGEGEDRHDVAFEEAIDMARQARDEIGIARPE